MSEPVIINITFQPIYKFEGWIFEYYRTKPFPPWPLKVDGEPRKRAGKKFWDMFERFSRMDVVSQEFYRL